jgi:hypothetical protein
MNEKYICYRQNKNESSIEANLLAFQLSEQKKYKIIVWIEKINR